MRHMYMSHDHRKKRCYEYRRHDRAGPLELIERHECHTFHTG